MKGASLIAPLGVRIPDDLKSKIQEQAKENGRSMNAEILNILEASFSPETGEETASLNNDLKHYARMLELKEQIIETQKETISHMEKSISSLEEHINVLKDQVDIYKKNYKPIL